MKRIIVNGLIFLLSTTVCWIIIDQLVRVLNPSWVFPSHYWQGDLQRYPSPYIEFKGKPNVLDHNVYGYRWEVTDLPPHLLKIAFYGGSTGYNGTPPIAKLIEKNLVDRLGIPVRIANFSVVSSNHRQHLHNILETYRIFKPDIIIFYGGFNEITQPAHYDPRPGYPYNYFYRGETSSLKRVFLEQSPTLYLIDRIGVQFDLFSLTPLMSVRKQVYFLSEEWKREVEMKYFETLSLAEMISKSIGSELCDGTAQFRFFYQPYQVPTELADLHQRIRQHVARISYGFDVSTVFDNNMEVYTDIVHVTQSGKETMSKAMTEIILQDKGLEKCFH